MAKVPDPPPEKPERLNNVSDYEAFLPEGATPEDVMGWVKELEAVSDQMEAVLRAMARRKRS